MIQIPEKFLSLQNNLKDLIMDDDQKTKTCLSIARRILADVRYDAQCNSTEELNEEYISRLLPKLIKIVDDEKGFLFKDCFIGELTMGSEKNVETILKNYPILKETHQILNEYFNTLCEQK